MIPKIIHYCWFGRNPLPEQYKKYMESWKKFCPDYEIKEWNEDNFDVTENRYCREAYEAKRWAFVSDYARLKIIHDYGGIYLDTDVELLKPLDEIISNGGYIGFQNAYEVNTGLGFAAEKDDAVVREMHKVYINRAFLKGDGAYNTVPCPAANTLALMRLGLKTGKDNANTKQKIGNMIIYPREYFDPLNSDTLKLSVTQKTYSIHHYAATWYTSNTSASRKIKQMFPNWFLIKRTERIARKDIQKIASELRIINE